MGNFSTKLDGEASNQTNNINSNTLGEDNSLLNSNALKSNNAQHIILTSLQYKTTQALYSNDVVLKENTWKLLQYIMTYIPVAITIESNDSRSDLVIALTSLAHNAKDLDKGKVRDSDMFDLLNECRHFRYATSETLNFIYKKIRHLRNTLLESTNSLISKIILQNNFELNSAYKESSLHENALNQFDTLSNFRNFDSVSIEVSKDMKFDKIMSNMTYICQQQGFTCETLPYGAIYARYHTNQPNYGLTIDLEYGKENNVLLISGSYTD